MVITRELTNMASASTASDIQLGSCATSIGDGAFSGYTNIIELELPEYVSSIGINAFKNCSNINRIDVGASTPPSLGLGAFDNTNNSPIYVLESSYDDYIAAEVWSNYSNRIMYEEMPYKVKLINDETFRKLLCDNTFTITRNEVLNVGINPINRVLFGECLTEIGDGAFSGTNIETVYIPSSVTTINANAFSNCTNLSGFTSNQGLETIGSDAFKQCTNLSYVELAQSISTLGVSAFEGCTSIKNITIPQSVTTISDSLFKGCTSLSSVTLPSNATSIGDNTFSGCTSLKNIDIPSNVTTIGYGAFQGCESLEQPIILDNVYSIESQAFSSCVNLTRLYVNRSTPPSLVNPSQWNLCRPFENSWFPIVVPQNSYDLYIQAENWSNYANRIIYEGGFKLIAKVRQYADRGNWTGKVIKCLDGSGTTLTSGDVLSNFSYYYNEIIREAEIGGCITTIDSFVFDGIYTAQGYNPGAKDSITALTIDDSVTDIRESAFAWCHYLKKVKLPSGLTSINANVFSGCTSLSSITIPDSVISIGNSAFIGCDSLTNVTIPSSVAYISSNAFNTVRTATFSSANPPSISSSAFNKDYVILYVPCEYYDTYVQAWSYTNYRIEPYGEYTKQEVIVGEYICDYDNKKYQKIGNYVSSDNINWCLTGFYSKGQEIDDGSNDCATRLHLEFNSRCTQCENNRYEMNDNGYVYTDFCKDYSSTTITYNDFPSGTASYITAATFGDCVTSIESDVITYYLRNIVSCEIRRASIPEYAFKDRTSLRNITLGRGVTSIGFRAFQNCINLTSVTIPSSVTSFGNGGTFLGCSGLTSCIFENGITSIAGGMFEECYSLSSVTIPNSVTIIQSFAFEYCYSLTNITLPSGLTSIGTAAFANCSSLTSINIPNSVTSIESTAFKYCSGLTSCTIGSGVTSIGQYVFQNCSSLVSVTVFATTPPSLGYRALDNTNNCVIFVPSQSVEIYRTAYNWSDYASRIQPLQTP